MNITKLTKKVKLPAIASAFYLMAGALGKLIGVITTPIFTRILSGEEYGEYARYLSIIGAVSVIGSAITSSSAVYKRLAEGKDRKGDYLRGVLALNLAISLVFCLLLFTFRTFLGLNRVILLPMSLQIFADGISAIYLTGAKFDYKYSNVTAILLIGALLPPTVSVFLILSLGGGFEMRVYSLLAVSLSVAAFALLKILRGGRIKASMVRLALKDSIPMLPHGISSALSSQADKLILVSIMGTAALAKYSVVFSLGVALQFTVNAIGSAISPWIIRRLKSNEASKVGELFFPMLIGYFALSMCLVAVGPEAIRILAPEDYLDAFPALMPIALSVPFSFISTVSTIALVYFGRSGFCALASIVGSVLSIILNYTLIGPFGYLGAGLSTLFSQAIIAIIGSLLLVRMGEGRIIYSRKISLPCLLGVVGCLLVYLLRQRLLLRALSLSLPALALIYCLFKAKGLVMEKDVKNGS